MSPFSEGLSVIASWYANKEFSSDWTSLHFPLWIEILRGFRERRCDVLEIGSWEGRSAVFFLEFLPCCRLTCIDTFEGGEENRADPAQRCEIARIEQRFDSNLRPYQPRFEKIKARSAVGVAHLVQSGSAFDIIYVDGSHRRDDVMVDSLLAWQILRRGGIMIWDDYGGGFGKPDDERVAPAIDAFLAWHVGEYAELHRGYQIALVKKADGHGQS